MRNIEEMSHAKQTGGPGLRDKWGLQNGISSRQYSYDSSAPFGQWSMLSQCSSCATQIVVRLPQAKNPKAHDCVSSLRVVFVS